MPIRFEEVKNNIKYTHCESAKKIHSFRETSKFIKTLYLIMAYFYQNKTREINSSACRQSCAPEAQVGVCVWVCF